jgi:prefoldin subunit 5
MNDEQVKMIHTQIEQVSINISEMKTDIKEINTTIAKLAVIEERQTAMIRISEQNTNAITNLYQRYNDLKDAHSQLSSQLEYSRGANEVTNKLLWWMMGGVMLICVSIFASARLL